MSEEPNIKKFIEFQNMFTHITGRGITQSEVEKYISKLTEDSCVSVSNEERALQGREPDPSEYHDYASRELAREKAYGGKPPNGFASWGDYWKSY